MTTFSNSLLCIVSIQFQRQRDGRFVIDSRTNGDLAGEFTRKPEADLKNGTRRWTNIGVRRRNVALECSRVWHARGWDEGACRAFLYFGEVIRFPSIYAIQIDGCFWPIDASTSLRQLHSDGGKWEGLGSLLNERTWPDSIIRHIGGTS